MPFESPPAESPMNGATPSSVPGPMDFTVLENVSKSYNLKNKSILTALDAVSFTVKEQEFVSIVGPSGCGKSTLLLVIAGLVPASNSRVSINAKVVNTPITDVGIVLQRDVLFDWKTVIGNIMLQAEMRRLPRAPALDKAHRLIPQAGLGGFENS